MDSVNTKIGQVAAKEAATIINEKSFNAANLVGFQTGASAFSSGHNISVTQQVRFVDKSLTELSPKQADSQSVKVRENKADKYHREENIDLSAQLDLFNDFFSAKGTELAFSVDNSTSTQVVTVKDRSTGDTIRQIPSEDVLKFAAKMQEFYGNQTSAVGILIDGRA
ncbi:MAG: flagellar protein FlaG [Pseudomonadota bacterium]